MKVRVYAPAVFCDSSVLDEDNYLHLPDEAVVHDVYKKLKVPLLMRKILICNVNQAWAKLDDPLNDGDVVSFFSAIAGG